MRIILALLFPTLFSSAASGQEGPGGDSLFTRVMDPIVVTGTRIEVARSNVPLTVSTVSQSAIRRSGETNVLPVISRRIPGLFVTERGVVGYGIAGGSAGQISIRGVGGSPNTNVLVMVDGHPQFMGIFGHPFPDAYVSSDAERVEVVRGPASILYGTGAMGGVVNIITSRMRRDGVRASASGAYGSFGTQHYSGSAGIRRNGREALLSLNHDRTDGHRSALDDFDLTNAYLRLASPLSRSWHVTVDGRVTQFHTEDPGPVTAPNDSVAQDADVIRTRVALSVENRHDRVQGAVKTFVNYGEHEIFDGFRSEDFSAGIVAYEAYRFSQELVATAGIDWKQYGGSSRNVLAGADFGDHAVSELGGYGFVQYAPVARFMVSSGLRLESNSEFGTEAVPQIGVAYDVATGTTLKASVARGFRSPTVLELYLFPPANPELEPESMWNYEVGISHARGRLQAELVTFMSEGFNLIAVQGMFPDVRRQNVGSFTNRGVEARASFAVTNALDASANISYLHMSTVVTGAPEWHGFGELSYATGRITLAADVEYVGGLSTGMVPGSQAGGQPEQSVVDYALVNVHASYRPVEAVEVFVRLKNLLDAGYHINAGYPMPGTTVMSGLRLHY